MSGRVAGTLAARESTTLLQQLVHPITVTLALLLLAMLALARRRRRTGLVVVIAAFAWTWLMASPVVASALMASLERRFPPVEIEAVPSADAIVVLGGGVHPEAAPRVGPNLGYAADRAWFGARLFAAGKAPLVITTGQRPYPDEGATAADAAARFLRDLGVPGEAILAPGTSRSTYTDAGVVADIMRERDLERVLLVTSALHMPRAHATFQARGVAAFPVPTDFEVTDLGPGARYGWLPSSEALWRTGRAFHEYVGIAWYRATGRI